MTPWLAGRRALIVGEGAAMDAVTAALHGAGAAIVRSSIGAADDDERIGAEMAALFEAGSVDILVHGGASGSKLAAEGTTLETWRDEVSADIDLRFLQSTEFVRRCLVAGQGGAILFLMPAAPLEPGHSVAATVAGAIGNLVKSLAVEWARDGIRVNGIATRVQAGGGAGNTARLASLGNLAAYILSDYGSYISGAVMGADEI